MALLPCELIVSLGSPDAEEQRRAHFRVELGLEVRDGIVCLCDLYDLIRWDPKCPLGQSISLADGYYRVAAYTTFAPVEEEQLIRLYFEQIPSKLELHFTGAPELC